jgi:hypothetical protein
MSGPETAGSGARDANIERGILSVNERALAYAMLTGKNESITAYTVDSTGARVLPTLPDRDWPQLVAKFKADPKDAIATARLNIFAIQKDAQLTEGERKARIERYVRAFLDLQVKLDIAAFPNFEKPLQGVPEYIPHGCIDMGSDPSLDPSSRTREMLRVDKRRLFGQTFGNFLKLFNASIDSSTDEAKRAVVQDIATLVYNAMPYDTKESAAYNAAKKIVGLDEVLSEGLAVCRHHALYTQVMLQACGMTSRLLKCDTDFGKGTFEQHAANLVRINGTWHVLDATNPDVQGGVGEIFMFPLRDKNVDPASFSGTEWSIQRKKDGKIWKYRPRNNMYYIVRNNEG